MRGYFSKLIEKVGLEPKASIKDSLQDNDDGGSNQINELQIESEEMRLESQDGTLDKNLDPSYGNIGEAIEPKNLAPVTEDGIKNQDAFDVLKVTRQNTPNMDADMTRQVYETGNDPFKLEKKDMPVDKQKFVIQSTNAETSEKQDGNKESNESQVKIPPTNQAGDIEVQSQERVDLDKIRKWVAGDSEATRGIPDGLMRETLPDDTVVNTNKQVTYRGNLSKPKKDREKEISGYDISIGSINLNIESPSKPPDTKRLPVTGMQSTPNGKTRLDRHYLRIG